MRMQYTIILTVPLALELVVGVMAASNYAAPRLFLVQHERLDACHGCSTTCILPQTFSGCPLRGAPPWLRESVMYRLSLFFSAETWGPVGGRKSKMRCAYCVVRSHAVTCPYHNRCSHSLQPYSMPLSVLIRIECTLLPSHALFVLHTTQC